MVPSPSHFPLSPGLLLHLCSHLHSCPPHPQPPIYSVCRGLSNTAFMELNFMYHKSNHFEVYNSEAFTIVKMLHNHHLHLTPKHFCTLQRETVKLSLSFPPFPIHWKPPIFVSLALPSLNFLSKYNVTFNIWLFFT